MGGRKSGLGGGPNRANSRNSQRLWKKLCRQGGLPRAAARRRRTGRKMDWKADSVGSIQIRETQGISSVNPRRAVAKAVLAGPKPRELKEFPAFVRKVGPPRGTLAAWQSVGKWIGNPFSRSETPPKGSKVDSSTAFDKSWFKTGGPKYYGCVTVYVCRKLQLYRIKPSTASRKDHKIIWGHTPAKQQEQWAKVMAKVIECTKECM